MKKLVFISNMASPYQVKFCYALNKYFNAEFWFHVHLEAGRPEWWKLPLGKKCRILDKVIFKKHKKYLSLDIIKELKKFNPDIVILGGFSHVSNLVAYYWARFHNKKVYLMRESYRVKKNGNILLKKKGLFTKTIKILYRKLDGILATNQEAFVQLSEEFEFNNVVEIHYAADIDNHLMHPYKKISEGQFTILFPNRLIPIYEPLLAIGIFKKIHEIFPKAQMIMNPEGELFNECTTAINKLNLENSLSFVEPPTGWNKLHEVYLNSDIILLPASFSNGNLSIYEAMASGCGIIISENILGTSNQLIVHQHNGFICSTVDDYVDAIKKYVSEPDLLKKHGIINKDRIKPFSLENTAKLFYDVLF